MELWNVAHAVLGLITIIFIQRAVNKILISVFLSREFKHDETNRAWWTGKWYGRGLGAHAFSQPAREYLVKIIELSLWTSDFLIGNQGQVGVCMNTVVTWALVESSSRWAQLSCGVT